MALKVSKKINIDSPTRTYPKCVGGVVQMCLRQFSIESMNAHKHKEQGNGPLPLSNACDLEDHNSNHGSSLHGNDASLIVERTPIRGGRQQPLQSLREFK